VTARAKVIEHFIKVGEHCAKRKSLQRVREKSDDDNDVCAL